MKKFKYYIFGILFVLLTVNVNAIEYTVDNIPNPKVTSMSNYVSNPDGILSTRAVSEINYILARLEEETNSEVAVVAVNSIGNVDIKTFAIDLFGKWGIGKEKADNGLLILLVVDQRAVTFEVGYGLEGILPDAISKRIQVNYMAPEFKNGDYDRGILEGVKGTVAVIENEKFEVPETLINWSVVLPIAFAIYIIYIILTLILIGVTGRNIKNNKNLTTNYIRYNEMRNKKTVVFVFTVFVIPLAIVIIAFFSRFEYGLLALVLPFCNIPAYIYSRYLMRQFRIQPFPCKRCGKMMRRLSEKEEDRYLSDSQQLEENINSRDHDVFLCDGCNETVIYSYDKNNIYSKCPRCGTKSFYKEGSRVMVQPTQTKDGIERTDYHCKYCGFDQHKDRKIPKIEVPPIIVGGGGRGSGGGFGGGGGSFGGGFSGGGGATTRW